MFVYKRFRSMQEPGNQGPGPDSGASCITEKLSNLISKNKLEQLRTVVTKAHERRFRRRRESKYGPINKGFTEIELQHFLMNARS